MEGPLRTRPMKVAGAEHFIERIYRESGAQQWVRETLVNAIEAGAGRIEYGIEWQAVEALGVYRRTIADDGAGMSADELVGFFNTFGGGGKPIGGVHENFGVGAKTSLFPWNRYGVVVVSWQHGEPAMIWMRRDPSTGEYGLRVFRAEDDETGGISWETEIRPFFDGEAGCDWNAVKPSWMGDHGTVIVLLGNEPSDHTVLGDPGRPEADIKGLSSYLNRRTWDLPAGLEVYVDELRTAERGNWPRSAGEAHGSEPQVGPDRRTNTRRIMGAKYYVTYPERRFSQGRLGGSGTVTLKNGVAVEWYLWEGERPAVQSYAAIGGYIAALYKNELYDVTPHPATYRGFGISESDVRKNLWLVIRPPPLTEEGGFGVYPRTDRNALLLKGGASAGEPLPIADWAAEFADQMPQPILDALRAARAGGEGTLADTAWRERLMERFGSLWRLVKLRAAPGRDLRVSPVQDGSRPRPIKRRASGGPGDGAGVGEKRKERALGSIPGPAPARKSTVAGGIPTYLLVKADDIGEAGMLAAWQPKHPDHPEGAVLINVEHPVLEAEVHRWRSMYPDHLADQIGQEVLAVYGELGVAKVAHSEQLKGVLTSDQVEQDLRSPAALTMSLLGLVAEEAVLATRIGGKFGRRRSAA